MAINDDVTIKLLLISIALDCWELVWDVEIIILSLKLENYYFKHVSGGEKW